MSTTANRTVERHCDVAVIGGSAAGLAAALQLARQRRSVIVVDAGEPRNAPAPTMHGYLGRESVPPGAFAEIARTEVRRYGAEVLTGRATEVTGAHGCFRVSLTGGHSLVARRVVVATGVVDELPAIEGLESRWGNDVIHCPFCHGYEVRGRRVVQIITHPMGLHPAGLFRQLTNSLTLVVHDPTDVDHDQLDALRSSGIPMIDARVDRVHPWPDGDGLSVELRDAPPIPADAVVISPRFRPRVDACASLGLELATHPSGLGEIVVTTPTGETSVPGVYAAGNVADPSQQVLHAAASGSWVGGTISASLADDDIEAATRPAPAAVDWEHRYSGEPIWSGNPNRTLVTEVTGLEPARALDVGAGDGADALWLAERGWQVTAADIAQHALDRVAAVAEAEQVPVRCLRADVNDRDPFRGETFDLVSLHFPAIPRTPDDRAVHNLVDAVAPGGTLLVVGHDLEALRHPIDTARHSRPFDPDSSLRVDDVVVELRRRADWRIEVNERRDREPGTAADTHHAADVVLRARHCPVSA